MPSKKITRQKNVDKIKPRHLAGVQNIIRNVYLAGVG